MRIATSILAVAVALLAACRSSDRSSGANQRDLGTGLNTIDRQYAKGPADVYDAAVAAVKSFDIKVETDRHDAMGGELVARRADGHKVTVLVRGLDKNNSTASVRVEPGNKNMADMIHEKMADKLGMGTAKGGLFGGNTLDGSYAADLPSCIAAAEATFRKLDITLTNKEVKENWAQLDGREKDSFPVQIKSTRDNGMTKVTFVGSRGTKDDSKAVAQRMKDEFERNIHPAR